MVQLDEKLRQILIDMSTPTAGHYAGDKQVYYLTYDPALTLDVKGKMAGWISLIKSYSFEPKLLSLAQVINDFTKNNPRRGLWQKLVGGTDKKSIADFYAKIGAAILEQSVIEKAILEAQEEVKQSKGGLLLLTGLEALHPFSRFGPIEQNIYNQMIVPFIILYPGVIVGTSLEFLGFYPPDGNYRSKHY